MSHFLSDAGKIFQAEDLRFTLNESAQGSELLRISFRLSFILFLSLLTHQGRSADLSQVEIYDRCFQKMVRDTPPSNDLLLGKVQRGELSGARACMDLFDKALFNENGQIANPNDKTSRAIVRSFHDFHGTWFQSRIPVVGAGQHQRTTGLVVDYEEQSLFITDALFRRRAYTSILTRRESIEGIRVRDGKANLTPFRSQRLSAYPNTMPSFASVNDLIVAFLALPASSASGRTIERLRVPNSALIPVGELIGVRATSAFVLPAVNYGKNGMTDSDHLQAISKVRVNNNFGGGIIGSSAYIAQNSNLDTNILPSGETFINRLGASRVFEDLLCQRLPTLTPADARAFVQPDSSFAFRKDASCMQCHAQIDPFAMSYRNLVLVQSTGSLAPNSNNEVGLPLQTYISLPQNPQSKVFAQGAPTGTLRYRDHRGGALVATPVSNIAGLGMELTKSRDFYECAVKRYFHFFTGVDVPLSPLPLPSTDAAEQAKYQMNLAHQKAVISLGAQFREHKSLRTLVSSIVSSATFKTRDFNTTKDLP